MSSRVEAVANVDERTMVRELKGDDPVVRLGVGGSEERER